MTIEAVCFDAFGTLIRYGERNHPFRLLKGHVSARSIMTTPESLWDQLASCGKEHFAGEANLRLKADIDGCDLYPEVNRTFSALRSKGLKIVEPPVLAGTPRKLFKIEVMPVQGTPESLATLCPMEGFLDARLGI
jgi:hypothetical protein